MTDTQVVAPVPPCRTIVLDGPLNFRDLGGYLTTTGGVVRWRRVFRSDSLDSLTEADHHVLTNEFGAPLVIDLRSPDEAVDTVQRASAAGPRGLPAVSVPLLDRRFGLDPLFVPGVALADVYTTVLRRAGDRIRPVLHVIAEAPGPVVFHCGTGRDRAGLVAAVLLGVLGVGEDDIARDYALNAATAETMRATLREVRRDHGSIVGYALDIGVEPDVIEALRDRLLW